MWTARGRSGISADCKQALTCATRESRSPSEGLEPTAYRPGSSDSVAWQERPTRSRVTDDLVPRQSPTTQGRFRASWPCLPQAPYLAPRSRFQHGCGPRTNRPRAALLVSADQPTAEARSTSTVHVPAPDTWLVPPAWRFTVWPGCTSFWRSWPSSTRAAFSSRCAPLTELVDPVRSRAPWPAPCLAEPQVCRTVLSTST